MTRDEANELLAKASAELVAHPCLRLGQALCNCMDLDEPWPELFHQENPAKAAEIFYSKVENQGERTRRPITGLWERLPKEGSGRSS